jgi:hypothetical protein
MSVQQDVRGERVRNFLSNALGIRGASVLMALAVSVLAPMTATWASSDGPAQLPAMSVQTAMANTPAPGATVTVSAGGNVQTALNNAKCGDTIKLAAGVIFSGVYTLPAKACDDLHWIIVRTSAPDSSLPAEGKRMTPCYSGVASLPGRPSFNCSSVKNVLAKMIYPQTSGVGPFKLASGANHYRLFGLEIARKSGTGFIGTLISTSGTANHIIVDRSWIHGSPKDDTQAGLNFNGMTYAAVIDSYMSDFHCASITGSCTDAHALGGGGGSNKGGPYRISGNFLEASGENVMFGGSFASTTPTDIEILRNHFFKPMTWKAGQAGFVGGPAGTPFVVKNLMELKNAIRVLVEGNIFENNWGGFSQNGYAILLTPKNQAGANGTNLCSICAVTDVTIRFNKISHSGAGISMANVRSDNGGVALAGGRYSIHDDTIDDIRAGFFVGSGTLFQVYNDWPQHPLNQITINHVTGFSDSGSRILSLGNKMTNPQMTGFIFTNNIVGQSRYPVWSVGGLTDCAIYNVPLSSVNSCFTSWGFNDNAVIATSIINYPPSKWPGGNYFPTTASTVQFVNFNGANGGDYNLLSTSPYSGAGSDGKDLGANINAIQTAIANVY